MAHGLREWAMMNRDNSVGKLLKVRNDYMEADTLNEHCITQR